MELKGKKINFLGDSITQGIGTSCEEATFVRMLEAKYRLGAARNYGIGGTRIARQIEMTDPVRDNDFNMRVEGMDPDADVIVVFGGTNDFGHGQAPLGEFGSRDICTFYGGVHHLALSLLRKYTGKRIVFLTPLHRFNEDGAGAWKPDGVVLHPLKDYVQAIREVCEHYSIPVLDLFAYGEMPGNVPEFCRLYMPDGLHPNDAGHKILADKIGRFLENL